MSCFTLVDELVSDGLHGEKKVLVVAATGDREMQFGKILKKRRMRR